MHDKLLEFSDAQSLAGGAGVDVISEDVFDAGAAVKKFEGDNDKLKVVVEVTACAGTTPDIRARLVGADNDALTSNPITIAETGVQAVVAGSCPYKFEMTPGQQRTAKRYYGIIYVQSGANHTATVNARCAFSSQSHHVR